MIKGLIISVVISALSAIAGYIAGGNPFTWFILAFLIQIFVTYLFNLGFKTWAQVQINRMEVERLNAIDKNTVVVKCAVCDEPHEVEINLKTKNEFRCKKCGALNGIQVSIENVQKTEMIPDGLITTEILNRMSEDQNNVRKLDDNGNNG